MSSTISKIHSFHSANTIKLLLLTVFVSACGLSIKASYDLTEEFDIFPTWFVPGFLFGISILIAISLYFVFQAWKIKDNSRLLSGKSSLYLLAVMPFSFVCTTAVHGFDPFRSDILIRLPNANPVLRINFAIAAIELAATIVIAFIYVLGKEKSPAVIGLIAVVLLVLIPNDNCSNPFNYWWIKTIGASPLMFVPNLYAALFVTCGLYGIHPKGVAFITLGICLGSLLLGVGHTFGIIW